ncbi:Glycosyl transferase [Seminavis robusta]|uniref:Glycosyl transferase n=1 Tax=Seminavis robusta TaxID=568900 RepID=A0A9N8E5B4_9STRA|nr:Glycosyl transferase [Seminavis robusta]|eukprot:Sro557_g166120.1 Glycosyl transferase (448) ;mRNA; f:23743-25086
MDSNNSKKKSPSKRKRNRKGRLHQNFTSYVSFGLYSTICSGCFLLVYLLLLVGLMPLLTSDDPNSNAIPVKDNSRHHLVLNDVEKQVIGGMGKHLKDKLQSFREFRGFTDRHLKDAAMKEFQGLRNRKKQQQQQQQQQQQNAPNQVMDPVPPGRSPGFFVLGMHRSGTSMMSGLLVQGSGYNVGGPLIGAHFDNQKGFFERIDAVLQNDEFLKSQRMWWSSGVRGYDADKAAADLKAGSIPFKEGTKTLEFLNDPKNIPWMQKDPRMCITLKTWLTLLKTQPAVLFTYRHPLEVALSLVHREKFELEHGLRLWIIYNMKAIQNSQGVCRVLSSNDAILANPLDEIKRIANELTTRCGVPEAPKEITQEDVDKFIDPNMQHGKKELAAGKGTLVEVDGCVIPEYDSVHAPNSPELIREMAMYKVAMQIHCGFKDGSAYKEDYVWPQLP